MHKGRILSRKGVRKTLLFAFGGAVLIFFVFLTFDLQVCQELKSRLKISIQGKFEPSFLLSSFYLRNAQLTWKEKTGFVYDAKTFRIRKLLYTQIDLLRFF